MKKPEKIDIQAMTAIRAEGFNAACAEFGSYLKWLEERHARELFSSNSKAFKAGQKELNKQHAVEVLEAQIKAHEKYLNPTQRTALVLVDDIAKGHISILTRQREELLK